MGERSKGHGLSVALIAALENRRKTLLGRIPKAVKHNESYLMAIAAELQRIELKMDPAKHFRALDSED